MQLVLLLPYLLKFIVDFAPREDLRGLLGTYDDDDDDDDDGGGGMPTKDRLLLALVEAVSNDFPSSKWLVPCMDDFSSTIFCWCLHFHSERLRQKT